MFERFSADARELIVRAQQACSRLGHQFIGTEHLLLAMLDDPGVAGQILRHSGRKAWVQGTFDADYVRARIERLTGSRSALLNEADAEALRSVGIDLDAVLARIEQTFGPDALRPPPSRKGWFGRRIPAGSARFSPRSKKVLALSLREALRLKDDHIASGHVLLGLLREGGGLAARILTDAGIDLADLRAATERAMRRAA